MYAGVYAPTLLYVALQELYCNNFITTSLLQQLHSNYSTAKCQCFNSNAQCVAQYGTNNHVNSVKCVKCVNCVKSANINGGNHENSVTNVSFVTSVNSINSVNLNLFLQETDFKRNLLRHIHEVHDKADKIKCPCCEIQIQR